MRWLGLASYALAASEALIKAGKSNLENYFVLNAPEVVILQRVNNSGEMYKAELACIDMLQYHSPVPR